MRANSWRWSAVRACGRDGALSSRAGGTGTSGNNSDCTQACLATFGEAFNPEAPDCLKNGYYNDTSLRLCSTECSNFPGGTRACKDFPPEGTKCCACDNF